MKGLWLCLHGPRFELDVVALGDTQPKALVSANGERVQQVCSKAQRQGVRPGMTVSTALSLEPELQLFTADTAACRQRLEGLALWVGRFSARVSFEPSLAGEPARGVVLEIGSMLHYFGGLAALWSRLESELAGLELELVCATGIRPWRRCCWLVRGASAQTLRTALFGALVFGALVFGALVFGAMVLRALEPMLMAIIGGWGSCRCPSWRCRVPSWRVCKG